MNMNTAPLGMHIFSALSLALLIAGTANAHHKPDASGGVEHRDKFGYALQGAPSCAINRGATATTIRQQVRQCAGAPSAESARSAPIHLAKPLSGSPYRSDKTDRYSF